MFKIFVEDAVTSAPIFTVRCVICEFDGDLKSVRDILEARNLKVLRRLVKSICHDSDISLEETFTKSWNKAVRDYQFTITKNDIVEKI